MAMTTITLRRITDEFLVTGGPEISAAKFKSCREAKE
jgi:hypothetical protein